MIMINEYIFHELPPINEQYWHAIHNESTKEIIKTAERWLEWV